MLNNIRKSSDSCITRVLVGMIIFAFIGWGIKDILQVTNNLDLVTFTDIQNITKENFIKAKVAEINNLQKQTATNFSEEEIRQLNIDDMVIKRLINHRVLNYLVRYYDLDLSEDTVIQFIKEDPVFKNEQGIFDIKIFKDIVKHSSHNEEEYLLNVKEKILIDTITNTFLGTFQTSKIIVKNIIDYLAEVRIVDLVWVDLKRKPKNLTIPSPTIEQLQYFYQNHQELFELAEKRSFAYIRISNKMLQKKINITKDEPLNFYNENIEKFGNKNFDKVKPQVNILLQQQKIEEFHMEFARNLEDDVAAGLCLTEIAEKYELPIQHVNDISYQDLINDKTAISEITDNIFELTAGELSYPIELQDKTNIILVELKSIQPQKIEEFTVVKDQVVKLHNEEYLSNYNLKTIENIAKEYKPDAVDLKQFMSRGITIQPLVSFARSKIEDNTQLPTELLLSIFQVKINSNSPIFQLGNKAYFAHVQSKKINQLKRQKIQKNLDEHIANTIKESVMEELIHYITKKNKMQLNNLNHNNL